MFTSLLFVLRKFYLEESVKVCQLSSTDYNMVLYNEYDVVLIRKLTWSLKYVSPSKFSSLDISRVYVPDDLLCLPQEMWRYKDVRVIVHAFIAI